MAGREHEVDIAAVNGPDSVVVSGDRAAVSEIVEYWRSRARNTRDLRVSHAFHSPHMDGILGEFRLVAERLAYAAPTIPIISGLTGRIADDELCAPEYWVRQIRHTVRFYDGIKALAELGATKFVELGPDATLAMMAHDCLDEVQHCDATPLITSPLRRDRPEADTVRRAIAELHVHGQDVDWRAAFTAPPRRIRLPTYPFERHRYWLKPPLARVRDDPDGAIGPVEPQPCTGRPARGRAGG